MPKTDVTQYQLKFDGLDNFQLFAVSELTWPIDPYKQNGVQLVSGMRENEKIFFFKDVLLVSWSWTSGTIVSAKILQNGRRFWVFSPSLLLFLSKIFQANICTFVENVTCISYYLVISSKKWDLFLFSFCKVIANFIPLHRAQNLFGF